MRFPALRLAVGTLTILPSGSIGEIDRRTAGRAMLLAPIAVLPLAVAAAGLGWGAAALGLPPLIRGLIVVAALVLGTRALHLDGLADTVDGLGGGWDRERALAIMHRGDVGPMGVVALVLVLGLQASAFGQLAGGSAGAYATAAAICVSRVSVSLTCLQGVPAARADGMGALVAGTVARWAAVGSWLAAAGLLVVVTGTWWTGLLAVALAGLATAVVVRTAVRRFGGVTGDVMGAAVELTLTAILLGLLLR